MAAKIIRYAPLLLLPLLGLIPLACSAEPFSTEPIIVNDPCAPPVACEELVDCYSDGNYELGTECRNNQCVCPPLKGMSPLPCCLKGAAPNDCRRQCRHVDECEPEPPCAGSTASSSGGGAGGQGGGGGEGGSNAAACSTAADCTEKPADARCGDVQCVNGECRVTFKPIEKISSQLRGDCVSTYCDGQGATILLPDGEDSYNDGKECSFDTCNNLSAQNILLPNGSPCPELGVGVCFNGNCVECLDGIGEVCGNGFACDAFYCVPVLCTQSENGMLDSPLETGVDCGGSCQPCFHPQGCDEAADCVERVCMGGKCALPTHSDGVKNDNETGIDCGCLNCALCPDDFGCDTGQNCKSGVCWGGKCQVPACDDGVQNGDENGVDCGDACNSVCP